MSFTLSNSNFVLMFAAVSTHFWQPSARCTHACSMAILLLYPHYLSFASCFMPSFCFLGSSSMLVVCHAHQARSPLYRPFWSVQCLKVSCYVGPYTYMHKLSDHLNTATALRATEAQHNHRHNMLEHQSWINARHPLHDKLER